MISAENAYVWDDDSDLREYQRGLKTLEVFGEVRRGGILHSRGEGLTKG